MEEPNIPTGKLVAIDLSKSQFRGSGALYQSDRLTIGRSKFQPIEGPTQVIEKIVYQESAESQKKVQELESKLQECLMRYVLVSIDHKRISRELEDCKRRVFDQSDKVFESNMAFELQRMKTEVARLNQQLVDKEREIVTVRDSEIRKSMIQAGEMSVRLMALKKENERLQTANLEKIHQINQGNVTIHKVREEHARNLSQITNDPRVHELERIINSRDQEIRQLSVRGQEADRLQRECDSLRIELSTQQTLHNEKSTLLNSQLTELKQLLTQSREKGASTSETHQQELRSVREECQALRLAMDTARQAQHESQVKNKDLQTKLERDLDSFRREVQNLEVQLSSSASTVASLQGEKAVLSSKVATAESTVRTLEQGLKAMVAEKEQAQRTFSEIQQGFRQLQKERNKDREEVEELRARLQEAQEQARSLSAETAGQTNTFAAEKASFQREVSALRECLDVSQQCIKSLENELKEKSSVEMKLAEVIEAESRLKGDKDRERERELTMLQAELQAAVEKAKQDLSAQLVSKHQTEMAQLQMDYETKLQSGQKECQRLGEVVRQKDEAVRQKDEAVKQLEHRLVEAEAQLQVASSQSEQLKVIEQHNRELQQRVIEGSNLQQTLIEQLEQAKDSIDQYSERSVALEELRQTNNLLERELRDKGAKLIQIHKTLDEFQESIQRDQEAHSASLAKMKSQRDGLEKELEKANSEIERVNNEIVSKLQTELVTLVTAMETAQSQINAYKQQQGELLDHNQQLNDDLGAAAQRIESLAEEGAALKQKIIYLEAEITAIAAAREAEGSQTNPLETVLASSERRLQESLTREEQAFERVRNLEEELQGQQIVSNALKEELIQEAKDKLSLQSQFDDLKTKLDTVIVELKESQASFKALQEDHEELETELRLKEASLNKASVEISERNAKIQSLEMELEHTLSGTVTNMVAQNSKLSEADHVVRQYQERLASREEIIADLEKKGMLLADEVKRLSEERHQTSNILQQTIGELTKSRTREQDLRASLDKVHEELGDCKSQFSSLKFKLLDMESKSSVQTIGYEEMLKDKVGELESRDDMIQQLQGDLENLISKMRDEKKGWVSNRGDDLEIYIRENKRLAEELRQARDMEADLRETLEIQEQEIQKLVDRLDVFEADLTVNIKHINSQVSQTNSKPELDSHHGSAIKPSPANKSIKNSRSAIQNKSKVNLQPFREHFGSSKKMQPSQSSDLKASKSKSPKSKELQSHLNRVLHLKSLTGESSDLREAISDGDDEEIKIDIPFTSFGFKEHGLSRGQLKPMELAPKSRKLQKTGSKLSNSDSSNSSKLSKGVTSSSNSSSPSKRGANNLASSRVSRDPSQSLKQGSYLKSIQESAGLGESPKYFEHYHQPVAQLSNSRIPKTSLSPGQTSSQHSSQKKLSEAELYRAEAEKFRLMYNDAQRALLHIQNEGGDEDFTYSPNRQEHYPDRRVTVPIGDLLGRGPNTQMFRVDGVDLEVKVHEKSSPANPKSRPPQ